MSSIEMRLNERFSWPGRDVTWGRSGSGPAVVFCHGAPWSSRLWAPFAEALESDFTVHLWDTPWYTQSSRLAEHRVDFGLQGELLAALLGHWGLDRAAGRGTRLRRRGFAARASVPGAEYRSPVLVEVVAIPPTGSPCFRFVQQHADAMAEIPDYIHAAVVSAYIQNASRVGLRDEELAMLVAPWTTDDGKHAFYRQIAQRRALPRGHPGPSAGARSPRAHPVGR
jgi:pimeloyl-ACP methyl ester carboxylesterase